jgi:hypothetical protein
LAITSLTAWNPSPPVIGRRHCPFERRFGLSLEISTRICSSFSSLPWE